MNLFFQLQYIFGLNLNKKVMKKAYQVLAIIFLCSHVYVVFVLAILSNWTLVDSGAELVCVVFVLAILSNAYLNTIKKPDVCVVFVLAILSNNDY